MERGDTFSKYTTKTYSVCRKQFGWRTNGTQSLMNRTNTVKEATPEGFSVVFFNLETFKQPIRIDNRNIVIGYANRPIVGNRTYVVFAKNTNEDDYEFKGVYRETRSVDFEKTLSLISDRYPFDSRANNEERVLEGNIPFRADAAFETDSVADALMEEIMLCPDVQMAIKDPKHPCHKICSYQEDETNFQCPEPWNGDIDKAKIMVISSNPSYDPKETFPIYGKSKDIEFFKNRKFYRNVAFWRNMLTFCGYILGTQNDKEINSQIVSTEFAHCKSRHEYGVNKCRLHCETKWMKKILSLFKGDVILISGKTAREAMLELYPNGIEGKIVILMQHFSRTTQRFETVRQKLTDSIKDENEGKIVSIYKNDKKGSRQTIVSKNGSTPRCEKTIDQDEAFEMLDDLCKSFKRELCKANAPFRFIKEKRTKSVLSLDFHFNVGLNSPWHFFIDLRDLNNRGIRFGGWRNASENAEFNAIKDIANNRYGYSVPPTIRSFYRFDNQGGTSDQIAVRITKELLELYKDFERDKTN